MLTIGNQVRSKNPKGQIKTPGRLVGLIEANYYADHMLPKSADVDSMWGKSNPNWRNEYVAVVFYETPQRTATLEEWIESGMLKGISKEQLEASYELECPVMQSVAFPAGDLELVLQHCDTSFENLSFLINKV